MNSDFFANSHNQFLTLETSLATDELTGLEISQNNRDGQALNSFDNSALLDNSLKAVSYQPSAISLQDDHRQELVFIDSAVPDQQILLDNLSGATEVVVLDSQQDEVVQISQHLADYQQLDAVHIVSHGGEGQLSFSNTTLNSQTLPQYLHLVESWRNAMGTEGDIVLYGCNVSSELSGNTFITELHQLTNSDILASDDITGKGGDWDLETQVGTVETKSAFNSDIGKVYNHELYIFSDPTPHLDNTINDPGFLANPDIFNSPNFSDIINLRSEDLLSSDDFVQTVAKNEEFTNNNAQFIIDNSGVFISRGNLVNENFDFVLNHPELLDLLQNK